MIRPRNDEDVDRCIRLLRTVYLNDGYPANWPNDPEQWLAGRNTTAAWVADERGELVGHIALTAPDPQRTWQQWQGAVGVGAERLAVVRRLFVAPRWRRQGVATSLLDCAQREADRQERRLVLDVADHNHAAIDFWKRHGWLQVGRASLPPGDEGRALRLLLFVAPDAP